MGDRESGTGTDRALCNAGVHCMPACTRATTGRRDAMCADGARDGRTLQTSGEVELFVSCCIFMTGRLGAKAR